MSTDKVPLGSGMDAERCGLGPNAIRRGERRFRLATVVAAAASIAMLLSTGATSASAAPTPTAQAATLPSDAVALCPPVPGHLECLAERRPVTTNVAATAGRAGARTSDTAAAIPYGPSDLVAAYRIPVSTTTATVAIVDAYDAPDVEQDLGFYRHSFGLPACTSANGCFRKVNQNGGSTPLPAVDPDGGWAGETTLDVEMVSAVCPTCHILLVESDDDDDSSDSPNMEIAVQQATDLHAKYVSMSWGGGEFSDETGLDDRYFGAPDVAYVAASGDDDYGTSWPAANPKVVSVGGTSLLHAANARGWTESVWGRTSDGGTGSGCSAYEPRPAWQDIAPITSPCSRRAMNDVAMIADLHPGVAVYQDGDWWANGGTSVGAPIIAAMYAMAGVSTNASELPYRHRADFNDIADQTTNKPGCSSALCSADTGWDGPTGVGTPIGLTGFGAVPPNTITIRNPGTISSYAGASASVTVTATDSGGADVTFDATGLPPGIAAGSGGILSGRAMRAGLYAVTVTGNDETGAIARTSFRWNVTLHHVVAGYTPRRTGTLRRGSTVSAAWGGFRADSSAGVVIRPATHVQWYLNGRAIGKATATTFKIPASFYHQRISFRLTATATNYAPYSYTTARSALIG